MVQNQAEISDAKNVFAIGALGAGKSTIISTLFYDSYKAATDSEAFKSSKSLAGFT